jgi:photosystem II stability/assembly factor-like uncharacterized protein
MWGEFVSKATFRFYGRISGCLLLGFTFLIAPLAGQTVSPDLFNALKWRLIGPFRGGRVAAVAGVPGSATTFYFGSVDGGVWKTADAGMVWTPIFDGVPVGSIGALAVAPSNPAIIYAGTGESDIRSNLASGNGVYRSTDAGATWKNIGLADTRQISRIVVDPTNPNIVYVGALGHAYAANPERGVYKSTDGGTNWIKVLDQGSETGVADLAMAIQQPNILFATTWRTHRPPWSTYAPIDEPGAGIFRSQDAGQTWAKLNGNGLPDGDWGRPSVAVSADGKRVYALIDCKTKSGLYRSDDGGDSWILANPDKRLTSRAWYFGNITVDPQSSDVFYVPNVALYRSEDGGKTISVLRGAPGGDDYHQIWIDPKDSSRMVLGTDQGTSISLNYGKTWSSWYNQPTAQLYHVTTDNKFPYTVYATQQDSGAIGVVSRTDHGQITPRDWSPAGASESGYIAPDPNDPNVLFLSGVYGDVSRFDLRTSFSQNVTPWPVSNFGMDIAARRYRDPWTPVLVFSPSDRKSLYLGTQYVMKTTDGGLHWVQISPDLTGSKQNSHEKPQGPPTVENAKERGYGVVYTIAPSSLKAELLWAGSDTGLIHLTRDGGKTWKDVTPKGLTDWSKIALIEASHFDPAVAYAAVDRHRLDDRKPYIYRTRDYGATWQSISDGISEPAFVNAIREDPESRGLLMAGTEFGIDISFDDGDHWQPLQLNLPATSVRDMVFHDNDLIIATHGRSFWVLDDIAALRQVKEAEKSEQVWLYRPTVVIRVDNDSFQGTPIPPDEPLASNPPNGAVFDYYLAHAANHVKLEVFDSNHELVRNFSSDDSREQKLLPRPIADRWFPKPAIVETSAGMHRYIWNLAWGKPETSDRDTGNEDYGLRGPRVIPGNYEVRITVDGKSQSQPLHVIMDPRSPSTVQELDHQVRLGRQVYAEAISASRAIAEIGAVQKQIADITTRLDDRHADLKSSVSGLQAKLASLLSGVNPASAPSMGLESASAQLASALSVIESGDRAVPSQAVTAYQEASQAARSWIAQWKQCKAAEIPHLNDELRKAESGPIQLSAVPSPGNVSSDTDAF